MDSKRLTEIISEMTTDELYRQRMLLDNELKNSSPLTESEYIELFNEKPTVKCIGMWELLGLKMTIHYIDEELEKRQ